MGVAVPQPPDCDYATVLLVRAFHIISRARRTVDIYPQPLSTHDIDSFLSGREEFIEYTIFERVILALDNWYIEDRYKAIEKLLKKPPAKA